LRPCLGFAVRLESGVEALSDGVGLFLVPAQDFGGAVGGGFNRSGAFLCCVRKFVELLLCLAPDGFRRVRTVTPAFAFSALRNSRLADAVLGGEKA